MPRYYLAEAGFNQVFTTLLLTFAGLSFALYPVLAQVPLEDVREVPRSPFPSRPAPPAPPAAPRTPPPPPPVQPSPPPSSSFIPPRVPNTPFTPPIVVPTDVTSNVPNSQVLFNSNGPSSIDGLMPIPDRKFPSLEKLAGSSDFILVLQKDAATNMEWISKYAIALREGQILVGVRKPSETGMVVTNNVSIALFSNGRGADAVISNSDGVVRIGNLDGMGENVRVRLTGAPFSTFRNRVFALKPGMELVVSSNPLRRKDIRPADGIGRRQTQLVENRHVAISQFSVESVLNASALVANLQQKDTGIKEKRILADMSKMAAVLNHVEGSWGYASLQSSSKQVAKTPKKAGADVY